MKKYLMRFLLSFLFITGTVYAESLSDVKGHLIDNLSQSGYIDKGKAAEIKGKFILPEDSATEIVSADKEKGLWNEYASWSNFLKFIGVILVLAATGRFIGKIVKRLFFILKTVPFIVYQLTVLAGSLTLTFMPFFYNLWPNNQVYAILFGALANIFVVGWICSKNKRLRDIIKAFYNKHEVLTTGGLSLLGCVYFRAFTLALSSQLFGLLSVVSFAAGLFLLLYWIFKKINKREPDTNEVSLTVILTSLALLTVYAFNSSLFGYFSPGIQYVFTAILIWALFYHTLPLFESKNKMFYFIAFTFILSLSAAGYMQLDTTLISTLIFCAYYALIFIWLVYYTVEFNKIAGLFTLGIGLYGTAMLLEKYGSYLVFHQ